MILFLFILSTLAAIVFLSWMILGAHYAMMFKKPESWPVFQDKVPRDIPKGGWDDWSIDERRAYVDICGRPEKRELLWYVRWWGNLNINDHYTKPIFGCPICMASVWGVIPVFLFLYYWHDKYQLFENVVILLLVALMMICAIAGRNRLILDKFKLKYD